MFVYFFAFLSYFNLDSNTLIKFRILKSNSFNVQCISQVENARAHTHTHVIRENYFDFIYPLVKYPFVSST